jgi:hypothetical protein
MKKIHPLIKNTGLLLATLLGFATAAVAQAQAVAVPEISILKSTDVDIVYHCLAYFQLPGDSANLYSSTYMKQVQKAKQDLEIEPTALDLSSKELTETYRRFPGLRFLNLALFMADDYATFKQALLEIDFKEEAPLSARETLEERLERDKKMPLLFGNARRLIPLLQKRFPSAEERAFLKRFAECMDEEYNHFYRPYRESRSELDEEDYERFLQFWKADGAKMLAPWANQSRTSSFTIYLCPVMKTVGRGVAVNQGESVLFNVVAPLPESQEETRDAFFVILHETVRRVTDDLVDEANPSGAEAIDTLRENAAFEASHLYLKHCYSSLHAAYLRFFLNFPVTSKATEATMEMEFEKSYPLPAALKKTIAEYVTTIRCERSAIQSQKQSQK